MHNRIKFQVWSDVQRRWRTAYVHPDKLQDNIEAMCALGYTVRVNDTEYYVWHWL